MKNVQDHFNEGAASDRAAQYPGGKTMSDSERHANAMSQTRSGESGVSQSHRWRDGQPSQASEPAPVPGVRGE
jgi:hypothetical protein